MKTALQISIVSSRVERIMVINLLEYRRKKAMGGTRGVGTLHGSHVTTDSTHSGAPWASSRTAVEAVPAIDWSAEPLTMSSESLLRTYALATQV